MTLNFSDGELDIMMDHTRYMTLLAKVYQKSERLEDALLSLTKAREMQARYLSKLFQTFLFSLLILTLHNVNMKLDQHLHAGFLERGK